MNSVETGLGFHFYQCTSAFPGTCQCITIVPVEVVRRIILVGVVKEKVEEFQQEFVEELSNLLDVATANLTVSDFEAVIRSSSSRPSRSTAHRERRTVDVTALLVTVITSTVEGFDTPPLTNVTALLDLLSTNTAFVRALRKHDGFFTLSSVATSALVSTTESSSAISTTQFLPPQNQSKSSDGVPISAVAGIAAGLVIIALIFALLWVFERRKLRRVIGDTTHDKSSSHLSSGRNNVVNPVFEETKNSYEDQHLNLNSKRHMLLGNTAMNGSTDVGAEVIELEHPNHIDGSRPVTDTDDTVENLPGFSSFEFGETSDGEIFDLDNFDTCKDETEDDVQSTTSDIETATTFKANTETEISAVRDNQTSTPPPQSQPDSSKHTIFDTENQQQQQQQQLSTQTPQQPDRQFLVQSVANDSIPILPKKKSTVTPTNSDESPYSSLPPRSSVFAAGSGSGGGSGGGSASGTSSGMRERLGSATSTDSGPKQKITRNTSSSSM